MADGQMGRKGCSRGERSDKIVLGEEEDQRYSRRAEALKLCNKRVWQCSKMGEHRSHLINLCTPLTCYPSSAV